MSGEFSCDFRWVNMIVFESHIIPQHKKTWNHPKLPPKLLKSEGDEAALLRGVRCVLSWFLVTILYKAVGSTYPKLRFDLPRSYPIFPPENRESARWWVTRSKGCRSFTAIKTLGIEDIGCGRSFSTKTFRSHPLTTLHNKKTTPTNVAPWSTPLVGKKSSQRVRTSSNGFR